MNCGDAKLLIAPHILGDVSLTASERGGLEDHLLVCSACQREYHESERVIRLLQGMRGDCLRQALGSSQEAEPAAPSPIYKPRRTVAEGWADLKVRIERLPETHRRRRRARMVRLGYRTGALAACLVIAVLAGVWSSRPEDSSGTLNMARTGDDRIMGTVTVRDAEGVERQPRPLIAGELLAPKPGQSLQLRIWDRHEISARLGARLAANRSSDGGCVIALSNGRIMASVDRAVGEGLFRVVTPHVSVTVTGTVFSVTATTDRTDLAVTEGTIEASARTGDTRLVYAGQSFTTDGTAFTPRDSSSLLLAAAELVKDPAALTQQSSWYQRRFAPLLRLRDYLAGRDVEVDEATLLAVSAELWCLQYAKNPTANLPPFVHRRTGLERAARFFGYEAEWLEPTSAAEATGLAEQAILNDALVLTFGGRAETVTTIDAEHAIHLAALPAWSYRFLGEHDTIPFPLCRITKATAPLPSRQELARQAVNDVRTLLTEAQDDTYLLGRAALQTWAQSVKVSEDTRVNDPLILALNAVSTLGLATHERYRQMGVDLDRGPWASICTDLRDGVWNFFATSAFTATACEWLPNREYPPTRWQTAVDRFLLEMEW